MNVLSFLYIWPANPSLEVDFHLNEAFIYPKTEGGEGLTKLK